MTTQSSETRSAALDAYIDRRGAQGFRVETRSGLQAVLVRRHPLYSRLRWIAGERAVQRVVVSVDEHAEIAALPAQPLRW